jgi:beta-glucosidase
MGVPFKSSDSFHSPLFNFGFGLSYSNITYSNLALTKAVVGPTDSINVTVRVHNAGPMDAWDSILVFVRQVRA